MLPCEFRNYVGCSHQLYLFNVCVNSNYVFFQGTIAYVPQQAWIQNATLRDNVLFGKKYSHLKYDSIMEACAMKTDLKILPGGDQTEIGEKVINVSSV